VTALVLLALGLVLFAPSYALQWLGVVVLVPIMLGWLYREIVRVNLSVGRKRDEIHTYRNEEEYAELVVRNGSFLPLAYLSVSDRVGGLFSPDEHGFIVTLKPGERRVLRYRIRGHQRGEYQLGPIRLHTADPLGFFQLRTEVQSFARVVIYPRILPADLRMVEGIPSGSILVSNPVHEDVTRYRSMRGYIPGDDPRRINWKASARMGELQVMEYEATIDLPVVILLNLTATDYVARHRWHAAERAIEVAASLAYHTVQQQQALGLETSGVVAAEAGGPVPSSREDRGARREPPVVPVGPSHNQAVPIFETLARVRLNFGPIDCVRQLEDSGRTPYRAHVCYVGPELSTEQRTTLGRFYRSGRQITCFYVVEQSRPKPPAHEFGRRALHIPEHGGWDVA
jgi:hypothetical protein